MDAARAARAHIVWTSIALVLILIASCLTYIFMSKVQRVHECQGISTVNVSAVEIMFSKNSVSREQWLFKARNYSRKENLLIWQDEWQGYGDTHESILNHTNTSMVIREKGIYLVYIQANFLFKSEIGRNVELRILVYLSYDGENHLFAAAQDTLRVTDAYQDAKLNTFLLMKMLPTSQISVKVFPSEFVNYEPQPISSFITIIKWADNW